MAMMWAKVALFSGGKGGSASLTIGGRSVQWAQARAAGHTCARDDLRTPARVGPAHPLLVVPMV